MDHRGLVLHTWKGSWTRTGDLDLLLERDEGSDLVQAKASVRRTQKSYLGQGVGLSSWGSAGLRSPLLFDLAHHLTPLLSVLGVPQVQVPAVLQVELRVGVGDQVELAQQQEVVQVEVAGADIQVFFT